MMTIEIVLLTALVKLSVKTATRCYGWALIANHFYLLLKTGMIPIAAVMRRLFAGYAVSFNCRHGHVFQTAAIRSHLEDLETGSNTGFGPKDFFKLAPNMKACPERQAFAINSQLAKVQFIWGP